MARRPGHPGRATGAASEQRRPTHNIHSTDAVRAHLDSDHHTERPTLVELYVRCVVTIWRHGVAPVEMLPSDPARTVKIRRRASTLSIMRFAG